MRAGDLAARAGISYRQLDVWTRSGLVQARHDFRGPGNPRHYDDPEAAVVIDAGQLVAAGVAPAAALTLARAVHADGHAQLGPYTVHQEATMDG